MINTEGNKRKFDLEDRTMRFARNVRTFVTELPKTVASIEDGKQLIRASGSVGANYIEANEALSKKDFFLRIKICRKEAKESRYWLQVIEPVPPAHQGDRQSLTQEATELMKIFNAIVLKA